MSTRATIAVGIAVVVLLGSAGSLALGAIGPSGASSAASASATATHDSENTTIDVTASAQLSAQPDMATVRLAVVATADSADAAREQVAKNSSRMRAALDEAGVDAEDVRTTNYDIGPVYEETTGERELVGYRAIHTFEVDVTTRPAELGKRTGTIIDTAVGNGASRVDGVRFTLSEETRRDLRAKALEQAMRTARDDAEVLATSSNLSVSGVRSITTTDTEVQPFELGHREESTESQTIIEPGPVTVSATVSVTYRAD